MPFKPGQSGNPGGQLGGARKFATAAASIVDRIVLKEWEKEVTGVAPDFVRGPDWLECSRLLVAYAYGKPAAQATEEMNGAYTVVNGKRMSFDELKQHNAIAAAVAQADEQH